MKDDRNYYRKLLSYELIDAARYGDNELAIVLAERLDVLLDVEAQLEDTKEELARMTADRDFWRHMQLETE
jgi:hypothetical protein